MRRSAIVALGLVLVLSVAPGSRLAAQNQVADQSASAWFVELRGAVGTFRSEAAAANIQFSERFVFGRLWRGLSVNATAETASRIGALASVSAVYPVLPVALDPSEPISPDLAHALTMTGADLAQASGLTGTGVKVGVIDTGVDYDHPDLGGGFGPGYRVATGYDFVGDRFDASAAGGALIPHPDAFPDDCNGHGTHVAGIVGASGEPASGGARGVAPGVTFGAYRVFGCDGSTDSDIMVAAMERALADGMQVVNMSIGSAFQTWPQYPTAVAADALVDAGVAVVVSIGNSGASGLYSASSPGVAKKVIGVASFENTHINVASFIANPGGIVMGYVPLSGTNQSPPAPPTSGTTPPIVYVGRGCADGDLATGGAQPDPYLADPAGKVALILRGTCSFNEKYQRAADAHAVGVIIQNSAPGVFFGGFTESRGIFGIGISQADGNTLRALSSPTATWTDQRIDVANPTAGLISSFSSYGLTAELDLKPDVGAPGGFIRSTLPLEEGGYGTLSGTSMSSPHVAGAVALLLEARPGTTPETVRTLLQNSADPKNWAGNPALGFLEPVHRQGAGMLDIDDAIAAATSVEPSKLSLGESESGPATRTLTIRNDGQTAVTYVLSHTPALSTGPNSFTVSPTTGFASVTFSSALVTVPGGGTATVDVSITANAALGARSVYGGYITLTPTSGAPLRVPYAGLKGDYQSIVVLAAGGCTFPGVFKAGGQTTCPGATAGTTVPFAGFTRQTDLASYNVEERSDRPVILFHLAHQSRHLEIRAVDQGTGRSYHVADADYLPRHATNGLAASAYGSYTWDGKRIVPNARQKGTRQELPAGIYRLQLVVTKALADPNNPAHVETWNSPLLNIVR